MHEDGSSSKNSNVSNDSEEELIVYGSESYNSIVADFAECLDSDIDDFEQISEQDSDTDDGDEFPANDDDNEADDVGDEHDVFHNDGGDIGSPSNETRSNKIEEGKGGSFVEINSAHLAQSGNDY